MRTASAGGRLPWLKKRRTLLYEAVSTSIEKVERGAVSTLTKRFSTMWSYASVLNSDPPCSSLATPGFWISARATCSWSSPLTLTAFFSVGLAGAAATEEAASVSLARRSEEHTSELQSQSNLVCRLLLEKKKT